MTGPRRKDSGAVPVAEVAGYLRGLQDSICRALAAEDGAADFGENLWERAAGGGGRTRVLAGGDAFEQAGVGFSDVRGDALPAAATARRPELAGRRFRALGVSLVIHPRNPHVPISHANVRFLLAERDDAEPLWWFGGGFDLTPCYPYADDAVHWHRVARDACTPFGEGIYPRLKAWCDEYFYLPHRDETRGIGGLFFDDLSAGGLPAGGAGSGGLLAGGGFERAFEFLRSVGDHYLPAYLPIVHRRKDTPYGERERAFQLYRRGRYVEFNLLFDRGTRFGIQSDGRAESILMSLPPLARWQYGWRPEPGSPEERLMRDFLRPRDWLGEAGDG